jgi:hypothetical protein
VLVVIYKVANLVYQFVKKCIDKALTALNLPLALESIFDSFKKYVINSCCSLAGSWYLRELGAIRKAFKQMSFLGAICFVVRYSVGKAMSYAGKVLELLGRFQVRPKYTIDATRSTSCL